MQNLRIASRKSALALWQAEFVQKQLKSLYPKLEVSIIGLQTEGDKHLESDLTKMGGKGLFVKALEDALLENRADIAVHSLKDMPADLPPGLTLTAILKREDARDVLLVRKGIEKLPQKNIKKNIKKNNALASLPANAVVGTSSLRRQSQLFALRADLQTKLLRGNVDTRVQKLMRGEFDAIILAYAGLKRLNLLQYVDEVFSIDQFLPAVGQGALCIECRSIDKKTQELVQVLHHEATALNITAERTLNKRLGGSCQLPIAAYAEKTKTPQTLKLQAMVGSKDGKKNLRASVTSATNITEHKDAITLGNQLADLLIDMGAKEIIEQVLKGK